VIRAVIDRIQSGLASWWGHAPAASSSGPSQGLPVNLGGYEFARPPQGAAARLYGIDQALLWVVVALLMWGMVMVITDCP